MLKKTVSVITYGCRMNQADSETWAQWLQERGMTVEDGLGDIVIVNTCTVTETADREAVSSIKRIRRKHPNTIIVVTGCGIQRENNPYQHLKEVNHIVKDMSQKDILENILPPPNAKGVFHRTKTRALIPIQTGCDNHCSYCVVPFVRGRSRSRSIEQIITDIQNEENRGVQEVVLTGINIGAYGCRTTTKSQESKLGQLLEQILRTTSVPRIRLSSLGPEYFHAPLYKALLSPRLCDHIHLSVQAGSDRTLERMNRRYSMSTIYRIVETLRKIHPDIAITADIIVGFPGENKVDFDRTCQVVQSLNFAKIHVFPFSPRMGTVGALLPNQIPLGEKIERARILRGIGTQLRNKYLRRYIGRELSVLFERKKVRNNGWSTNYCEVSVQDKKDFHNTIRDIYAEALEGETLIGRLL